MEEILTLQEVADLLKLNRMTVLKMAQKGELPGARIGNQWRFDKGILEEWFKERIYEKKESDSIYKNTEFRLDNILKEDLIIVDLPTKTKDKTLKYFAKILEEKELLHKKGKFFKCLAEREKLCSTSLGNGVAIPHIRNIPRGLIKEPLICIGISKKGIDFEASDHIPVHYMFLICAPNEKIHLRMMGTLTRLIHLLEIEKRIANAKNSKEIIKIMKKSLQELEKRESKEIDTPSSLTS